jgi:hypothetical protein
LSNSRRPFVDLPEAFSVKIRSQQDYASQVDALKAAGSG